MKLREIVFIILTITVPALAGTVTDKDSGGESTANDTIKSNYNPLHVGDVWYYYNYDWNLYTYRKVLKDTIVNNKRYFYMDALVDEWERNDEETRTNYKLDIDDLNENERTDDEIVTDSIPAEIWTYYTAYRYAYRPLHIQNPQNYVREKGSGYYFGQPINFIKVRWLNAWIDATISDKFGLIIFAGELAPPDFLVGCIIDGVHYGNTTGIEDKIAEQKGYQLYPNYPNPFNPETVISFSIPERVYVKGTVFSSTGERVAVLQDGEMEPGSHSLNFNGRGLSSGVYIFRLEAGGYSKTIKMMLLQ
ncbi:MAG: T9SS type A sorting domain-containing protein [Ignavibacteriaceae bacterium]|nr:T9SS type A sorting domain-containing protein [Ignavibacteriaceae bacterium]NUM71316.1 T9SS type A sorting domain-containing protein [Ignavibacteriaceae bacterium]